MNDKPFTEYIREDGTIDPYVACHHSKEVLDYISSKIKWDKIASLKERATKLHETFCTYDHTDQCMWYYGEDDWTQYNYVKYLIAAFNLTVLGYGEKSIDLAIRIAKTCRGEK